MNKKTGIKTNTKTKTNANLHKYHWKMGDICFWKDIQCEILQIIPAAAADTNVEPVECIVRLATIGKTQRTHLSSLSTHKSKVYSATTSTAKQFQMQQKMKAHPYALSGQTSFVSATKQPNPNPNPNQIKFPLYTYDQNNVEMKMNMNMNMNLEMKMNGSSNGKPYAKASTNWKIAHPAYNQRPPPRFPDLSIYSPQLQMELMRQKAIQAGFTQCIIDQQLNVFTKGAKVSGSSLTPRVFLNFLLDVSARQKPPPLNPYL
jgi:hypothetical protein